MKRADELKICPNCEGNGYTIEVEAQCCGNLSVFGECCNNPDAVQVQVACSCDMGYVPQNAQQDEKAKENQAD